MELFLRGFRNSIASWRPQAAPRASHYALAILALPGVMVIYLLVLLLEVCRRPVLMPAKIPGGAELACRLADIVQFYIFLFGIWEPDISIWIQQRLQPGDTFYDVGAHVGYYSLLAAPRVGPEGHVVAVEASPSTFQQLTENLERNRWEYIRAVNVAASNRPGTVSLYQGPVWNRGWSSTRENRRLPLECEISAEPIDQILTLSELRNLRLIKVDVEGTERELFDGLVRVLLQARGDAELIIELSPRWWRETPNCLEDSLQPFREAGFHLYVIDNDYKPWRYFWPQSVRAPRRCRRPLKSWIGQYDVVLSRVDREEL